MVVLQPIMVMMVMMMMMMINDGDGDDGDDDDDDNDDNDDDSTTAGAYSKIRWKLFCSRCARHSAALAFDQSRGLSLVASEKLVSKKPVDGWWWGIYSCICVKISKKRTAHMDAATLLPRYYVSRDVCLLGRFWHKQWRGTCPTYMFYDYLSISLYYKYVYTLYIHN